MKRLFLYLTPLALGLMVGCSYDDSAILERISTMEKEQDQMQEQIDTQQALLNALANNLTITTLIETDNGYTITLSDGSTIGIFNHNGDSLIESISTHNDCVQFILSNGQTITIPIQNPTDNNKIYYTSSDHEKIFPLFSEGRFFGAILVTNTYNNGIGTLGFDSEVTMIGANSFQECVTLTSITIPESVTNIGNWAFSDCSSLESIYCKPTTPPKNIDKTSKIYLFSGSSNVKIYVPNESLKAYQESGSWSYHKEALVGYDFNE